MWHPGSNHSIVNCTSRGLDFHVGEEAGKGGVGPDVAQVGIAEEVVGFARRVGDVAGLEGGAEAGEGFGDASGPGLGAGQIVLGLGGVGSGFDDLSEIVLGVIELVFVQAGPAHDQVHLAGGVAVFVVGQAA